MPGTFWYHPHFHGSTALQVGQGAAGLFFVEEDDSDELFEIPSMIKNMPQVDMVLQHMDQFFQELTATSSGDTTWSEGDDQFLVTNTTTDRTDLMLVNMQYIPKVTMDAGKWYRWRMVLSSVIRSLALRTELENSGCEFHLLAKDGIFLTDAPREGML